MRHNLSEIQAVIRDRRSIPPEKFSNRKVHKEILEDLLDAARWAPTHGLTQPWRFTVFTDDGLKKLSDFQSETYKTLTSEQDFKPMKFEKLRDRPMKSSAVIAIGMKRQESGKIPEIEEVEAVACAVQNVSLMAAAYGLSAYWSSGGVTYKEETKAFLGLNSEDKVLGFLYIGYPEIEWPSGQRRPIEYYTTWINH